MDQKQTKIANICFMKLIDMKTKFHNHTKLTINKSINYYMDLRANVLYVDYDNPKDLVAYKTNNNQINIYKKIERKKYGT